MQLTQHCLSNSSSAGRSPVGVLGGRPRLRVIGAVSGWGLAFGGWTRLPSASSLGFRPGLALGTGLPCSSTFGFGPGLRFGRGLPCLDKDGPRQH